MAYTVPQLRLFQEFEETVAASTSPLSAVMIAPHYAVHQYTDDSDALLLKKVVNGVPTKENLEYDAANGIEGASYPDKALGGKVDTSSVRVYFEDAPAIFDTFKVGTAATISGSQNNVIAIANKVLHSGNGYTAPVEYEVGDYVYFTPSTQEAGTEAIAEAKARIMSFIPSMVAAEIATPVVEGTGTSTFAVSAEADYIGTKDTTYVVVINKAVDNDNKTIDYTVYDTNNVDGVLTKSTTGNVIDVGTYGVLLDVPAGTISAGTVIRVKVSAAKEGQYSKVIVDTSVNATGDLKFCKNVSFELSSEQFNATQNSLSIFEDLKTPAGQAVYGGFVAVEYRERLSTFVGKLGSISDPNAVKKILGAPVVANPLAMMVYTALLNSNGNVVYYTAVASDDVSGYSDALTVLDEHSEVYSLVPYATSIDIQDLVTAYIDAHSTEEVMDWKIGWYGCDIPAETVVLDALTDGNPLIIHIKNNEATVQGVVDLTKCVAGDNIAITTADGIKNFTFDYMLGESSFRVYEGADSVIGIAKITHKRDSYEIADEVAKASAYFNNRRIRNIFADGLFVSSDINTKASNAFVAAACAGLRSASAPHQPLTRAELTGFVANPEYVFGAQLLNNMAENGTWLVVNDAATVYVRHQLTTDTVNYNLREDSKVTNADEISRTYRDGLSEYYGRANISPEFVKFVGTAIDNISFTIATRPYSVTLGPQIISYEPSTVEISPTLSDALIAKVRIDTPEPLNYLDIYLTIS